MSNIFTKYDVKKRKRDIAAYYAQHMIVDLFGDIGGNGIDEDSIMKRVESVLKEDQNSIDPYLKYNKGVYSKARRRVTVPITPLK